MIYTILVNWNGWRDTIECLTSLLAARHDGLTVVVCDNASRDESLLRLAEWADGQLDRLPGDDFAFLPPSARRATRWQARHAPEGGRGGPLQLVLLANLDNFGFAGGNNVGIALALADPACRYVFILNNDTEVRPDALLQLQAKLDSRPDLALCGATLVYHDDPTKVQGLGCVFGKFNSHVRHLHGGGRADALPSEADIEAQIDYVIGAAIFIRASVLRRIGGLSEDYFLYYEEMDLSRRLLPSEKMGWASKAVIVHKVGGSIGTSRGKKRSSDVSIYYDHRSRMRFYWNHLRGYTPFLALFIGRMLLAYVKNRDFRAAQLTLLAVGDFFTKDKRFRRAF